MSRVVVKEGYLLKAHPKEGIFSVTVWQKRYFVLWSSGTMEYYTTYQKHPEEYCSTLNLKETRDILAPISVGKKHNIIKLSVKKNDRDKDYWLDCDCPSLLNEWVNSMVSVAGLTPEEDYESSGGAIVNYPVVPPPKNPNPDTPRNKRRLPSLPMVMDLEYEVPKELQPDDDDDEDKHGEHYEEIDSSSSGAVDDENQSSSFPRRYSRTPLAYGGPSKNIQPTANKNGMLKRSPIAPPGNSIAPGIVSGSPNSSVSPPPPSTSHESTSPLPGAISIVNPVNNPEFTSRLSFRRQEMYGVLEPGGQMKSSTINEEAMDESGEAYEEVQFTTEVTVGERKHGKVDLRKKAPVTPKGNSYPNKSARETDVNIDNRPPIPVPPLRDSMILEMSQDLPPVPPPRNSSSEQGSTPPLYIDQTGTTENPPPIPERITSNRPPRSKAIKSYYTTEILSTSPVSGEPPGSDYNSESSDQSGDATFSRHHQQPMSLLATVVGNKPLPQPKPKPTVKPVKPTVKPKPVSKDISTNKPHPPPVAKKPSTVNKSPVKLPKPTQVSPTTSTTTPTTNSSQAVASNRKNSVPELPPKSVVLPARTNPQLPHKPGTKHQQGHSVSNTVLPALPPKYPSPKPCTRSTSDDSLGTVRHNKRPPMPLPKEALISK